PPTRRRRQHAAEREKDPDHQAQLRGWEHVQAASTVVGEMRLISMGIDLGWPEWMAAGLGVAFQQVQKYEKGTNRVSCSRLYEISQILDVPVTYFFSASGDAGIEVAVTEQFDVPELKDGFRLMTAFRQIQNNAVRKNVIALVETVATASKVEAK